MALWVYFVDSPRERTVNAETAQRAAEAAARHETQTAHPDAIGSFKMDVWVCQADVPVVPRDDVQKFEVTSQPRREIDVTATPVADDPNRFAS